MNQVLIFLHFVGLMLGATGGFGSALVMRRALGAEPAAAGALRGLGPMLANVSATGLALMWASGLVLVWSRWNGPGSLPGLLRRGNLVAAARLPKVGPVAGVSALLAVLAAVFTFSS